MRPHDFLNAPTRFHQIVKLLAVVAFLFQLHLHIPLFRVSKPQCIYFSQAGRQRKVFIQETNGISLLEYRRSEKERSIKTLSWNVGKIKKIHYGGKNDNWLKKTLLVDVKNQFILNNFPIQWVLKIIKVQTFRGRRKWEEGFGS